MTVLGIGQTRGSSGIPSSTKDDASGRAPTALGGQFAVSGQVRLAVSGQIRLSADRGGSSTPSRY